ncbi:MAG: DUF354 domain-containing protein [Candidatus Omnitrophota bacterium]|nr:DUF354 domain-containing protein [Candidatus Omnitrophota bacterium]
MRILIETHHPANILFFKYPARIWKEHGHEVLVAGRDRNVMVPLLEAFDWMPHEILTRAGKNNLLPFSEFISRQIKMFRLIRRFRPDVVVSLEGSYCQTAFFCRVPNIIFSDTEHLGLSHLIAYPFAQRIYVPSCFWKNAGKKQMRYNGNHQLSFLNPKYFQPDPTVLDELGVSESGYVLIRLSSWNTYHDIGKQGMGDSLKRLIKMVGDRFPFFIIPEEGLPEEYERYRLKVAPHRFHDVLAFARMVISEGGSTASEAACLGIPTVYVNPHQVGYVKEQEERFGLVYSYREPEPAFERIEALLNEGGLKEKYAAKRKRFLDDKINVTDYVVQEIEKIGKAAVS